MTLLFAEKSTKICTVAKDEDLKEVLKMHLALDPENPETKRYVCYLYGQGRAQWFAIPSTCKNPDTCEPRTSFGPHL